MGLLDKIKGMVNTDDAYGDNYGLDENEDDDIIPTRSTASRPGMNISGHDNSVAIELKVVRPESYASVTEIADHLLNHRTVVLNLEATNREVAKRLIDFLAGVAYSIDGQLKNVANNTYIIKAMAKITNGELFLKRRSFCRFLLKCSPLICDSGVKSAAFETPADNPTSCIFCI